MKPRNFKARCVMPAIFVFVALAVVLRGSSIAQGQPLLQSNDILQLARTPIILTNGQQLLALSYFSDSNHNYVVEFRDDIGFDLCNQWQPLTNAPHNYGIVFTTQQATNRFFRLRRIETPRAPLFALLANDTGTNSLDGITSDPTITGLALQFPAGTELRASLNNPSGPFVVITALGSPRYFIITRDELDNLNGTALLDGAHTLHLRALNGSTTLGSFELPFTLDTTPPSVTASLAPEFDSPPVNDGRTIINPVTINGQTEPGTRLELIVPFPGQDRGQPNYQIVSDTNGAFVLTNVFLAQGTNQFFFRALDAACNETISETRICWYGQDCSFPDSLADWRVFVGNVRAPGTETAGTVTVDRDKSCVAMITEGDSFLVTLSKAFQLPLARSSLTFTYSMLNFDPAVTNRIKDAFEVALVDPTGDPLSYPFGASRDSFLNASDGQPLILAQDVAVSVVGNQQSVVTLMLHPSSLGQQARLIFRLINNDRDSRTSVHISNIKFEATPLFIPALGRRGT